MMELTIDNQVYQFNFGMRFLVDINKMSKASANGIEQNTGFQSALVGIQAKDTETLSKVLFSANSGMSPRITMTQIYSYFDDEETDIEKLFDDVMGFFERANATKVMTKNFLNALEKGKATESQE